jgi:hypothetical protein
MKATNYTTSINTAATAVSSATTTWQDDQTRFASTAKPLVWLEMDKWGRWRVIDLRPGAVPQ